MKASLKYYFSAFLVSFADSAPDIFWALKILHTGAMVAPAHQRKKNERNRCPCRPTSTNRPATDDVYTIPPPLVHLLSPALLAIGAMTVKYTLFVSRSLCLPFAISLSRIRAGHCEKRARAMRCSRYCSAVNQSQFVR